MVDELGERRAPSGIAGIVFRIARVLLGREHAVDGDFRVVLGLACQKQRLVCDDGRVAGTEGAPALRAHVVVTGQFIGNDAVARILGLGVVACPGKRPVLVEVRLLESVEVCRDGIFFLPGGKRCGIAFLGRRHQREFVFDVGLVQRLDEELNGLAGRDGRVLLARHREGELDYRRTRIG